MDSPYFLAREIMKRIKSQKTAQVPDYYEFKYIEDDANSVTVLREKGTKAKIYLKDLMTGIEAVQKDVTVYVDGPDRLREFGITHINSPVWALLHLLDFDEFND